MKNKNNKTKKIPRLTISLLIALAMLFSMLSFAFTPVYNTAFAGNENISIQQQASIAPTSDTHFLEIERRNVADLWTQSRWHQPVALGELRNILEHPSIDGATPQSPRTAAHFHTLAMQFRTGDPLQGAAAESAAFHLELFDTTEDRPLQGVFAAGGATPAARQAIFSGRRWQPVFFDGSTLTLLMDEPYAALAPQRFHADSPPQGIMDLMLPTQDYFVTSYARAIINQDLRAVLNSSLMNQAIAGSIVAPSTIGWQISQPAFMGSAMSRPINSFPVAVGSIGAADDMAFLPSLWEILGPGSFGSSAGTPMRSRVPSAQTIVRTLANRGGGGSPALRRGFWGMNSADRGFPNQSTSTAAANNLAMWTRSIENSATGEAHLMRSTDTGNLFHNSRNHEETDPTLSLLRPALHIDVNTILDIGTNDVTSTISGAYGASVTPAALNLPFYRTGRDNTRRVSFNAGTVGSALASRPAAAGLSGIVSASLCPDCDEDPCVCPDLCPECDEDPCVCPDLCPDCDEDPCVCPDLCPDCDEDPCVCPDLCPDCDEDPCACVSFDASPRTFQSLTVTSTVLMDLGLQRVIPEGTELNIADSLVEATWQEFEFFGIPFFRARAFNREPNAHTLVGQRVDVDVEMLITGLPSAAVLEPFRFYFNAQIQASDENDLSNISVTPAGGTPVAVTPGVSDNAFVATVPFGTAEVDIGATLPFGAVAVGLGTTQLAGISTEQTILVEAANGDIKTYTITIIQSAADENDTTVSMLRVRDALDDSGWLPNINFTSVCTRHEYFFGYCFSYRSGGNYNSRSSGGYSCRNNLGANFRK